MKSGDWIALGLGVVSILLIPALVILIRGAIKWTRTEDKLADLVEDMRQVVEAKDRTHTLIFEQMKLDRDATDKRLRFLEEYFMRKSMR